MKNTFALTLLLACVTTLGIAARPQVVLGPGTGGANFRVPYHFTQNRTLSKDTTYILTGWTFVDSTYSLTIPAGTLIRGDSTSGGTLIISRGAQIFAAGTKNQPIIFTSNKPAGTRVPGDWGGVIILGRGITNKPGTQQIEGGFGTIASTNAQYGGTDSLDNSGVLQYVRIEFGGIAFAQDNEINGLTFGGVGRGTTVDHVQVSYANDDDFEFFGGQVEGKYLIGWRSLDDCFDTDFGFSGRLQFLYTKRDPLIFDASASGQSNGEESDNEGTAPYAATPRTRARFSNWTLVGPARDSTVLGSLSPKWGHVALLRRATELSIYNSIMMGWPLGINLRDTLTQRAALDGRLELRNISLQSYSGVAPLLLSSNPSTGNIAGFDAVAWFNSFSGNLGGSAFRQPAAIGLPSAVWNLDKTNNAVPLPGSEAATAGASFTTGRLNGDSWFTAVSYRGAFDPSLAREQQWDFGWANYEPNSYEPEPASGVTTSINNGWNLVSVPRVPPSYATSALFPGAVSGTVNSFLTGGYTQPTTLVNGEGYWAFYGSATSNTINGAYIQSSSVTVSSGNRWVLVGSVSSSVPASALTSNPPNAIVGGTLFSWTGSAYVPPTTLDPGKGYWVFVNAPCTLSIGSVSRPNGGK